MTIEQFLYRKLFTKAYWNYVYSIMRRRKYIMNQTKFMDETKVALLYIYMEMILVYYSDLSGFTSDDNIFTVAEINNIIDTFNDIAGSFICYQEF